MGEPVAHERNTSFSWSEHAGPFRAITAEQAGQYDRNGFFVLKDALAPAEVEALIRAIDPFEQSQADALRELEGGRFFIARADEITFTTHLVARSPASERVHALRAPHRRLRRPHRARCPSLLGPGGLQEAGDRVALPVAPGQRVRLCRAAAVPHLLGCADGRHRGERVPMGGARSAPARHAGPRVLRHRLRVPARPRRCRRGAGTGREHRGVLLVDAALDRSQPDRRRPQGLHRAVRAIRGRGGAARSGRRGAAHSRRRPQVVSTRCCAGADGSRARRHHPTAASRPWPGHLPRPTVAGGRS